MIRSLLSLLLLFMSSFVFSQSIVKGYLESEKKNSVEGIIVSLHNDSISKKFLSYCISDAKGYFELNYSGDYVGKTLRMRSLSYQDTCILLVNKQEEYHIKLKENIQKLREVQVRSTPIFSKGDTTTYITGIFAQKRDFSIGDVISRMPGFDLAGNGKITYQGREIEKYYIEGSDLLEERYSLANRNLPHKAVAAVEVLHNHQSKKVFENKISTDQTSINIKLKNAVAFTGTAQLGAAYKPLGRYINITPMMFSKKYQFIGSIQSNDIGDDLSTNINTLSIKDGELQGMEKYRSTFLGLPALFYPKVNKSRFLMNDANYVSINALRKLDNQSELKINAAYITDNVEEQKRNKTTYFLDDALFTTNEKFVNNFKNRSFFVDLNLKKNLSSIYLNNKLGYIQYNDKGKAIITGDQQQIIEAKTPHKSLYNILDCTIPFGKNFATVFSSVDINESDEDLFFSPSVFPDVLDYGEDLSVSHQNLKNTSILTRNYIQFGRTVKSFVLQSKVGFNYERQDLKTSMFSGQDLLDYNLLQNSIVWDKTNYLFEPSIKYEGRNLKMTLDLPLDYSYLDFEDKQYKSRLKQNDLLFKPRLFLSYKWNSYISSKISLRSSESIGDPNGMMQGNVVYDHRTMRSGVAQIDGDKKKSANFYVSYRNPISGVFANLSYNKKHTKKEYMTDTEIISPGVFSYSLIAKANRSTSDLVSGKISYYWQDMHLNLDYKSSFMKQKSNYLLSGDLKGFDIDVYSNSFKISFDKWQFLALDYDLSLSTNKQTSNGNETKSIEQKHKARICYYLDSRQWIELRPEYSVINHSVNDTQEALFTDLTYSYTPKNSRVSYLLECRNIFNNRYVYSTYDSSLSMMYNEYSLRPRQFVARVRITFGKN